MRKWKIVDEMVMFILEVVKMAFMDEFAVSEPEYRYIIYDESALYKVLPFTRRTKGKLRMVCHVCISSGLIDQSLN